MRRVGVEAVRGELGVVQVVRQRVERRDAPPRRGEAVAAVAYIAVPNMRVPGLRPRQSYLLHLLGGADLLPEDYVCTLRRQPTTATAEQPAEPPEAAAWFFVYGTLRPDGDGAWTGRFNAGLIGLPATLHGATLYDDSSIGYAAVVLDSDPAPPSAVPVRGYALTADHATLVDKLAEADQIEGCPRLYQRALRPVELAGGKVVTAHVYHRGAGDVRGPAVASGDWYSLQVAR